jgi:hypothetical protein
MIEQRAAGRPATLSEIVALIGEVEPAKAEAILATGATTAEIEQALAFAADQREDVAVLRAPQSSPVAAVYAILATELADDEREG